jgi:hypothetical protein
VQIRVRSLAEALQASPDLASVLDSLESSSRIARLVATTVKPSGFDALAAGACNWRSSLLILNAATASQAAKLRQLLPRLEGLLHDNGIEGIQIRVRVQPNAMPYPIEGQSASAPLEASIAAQKRARIRVPTEEEIAFAEKLAHTNMGPSMREAVERLQSTFARRLARSRHQTGR